MIFKSTVNSMAQVHKLYLSNF